MIRYGIGILAAGGIAASLALVACGEDDPKGPVIVGSGGAGNTGGTSGSGATTAGTGGGTPGSGGGTSAGCTGQCCPAADSCYGPAGKSGPGATCMARHSNPDPGTATGTPNGIITMRQTWIRVLTPAGNTIPQVYEPLNRYTSLPEPDCNTAVGSTGYMQLTRMDLTNPDKSKHTSTVGYATYTPAAGLAGLINDGACFAEITQANAWTDRHIQLEKTPAATTPTDFSLPASQMTDSTGAGKGAGTVPYPKGLPPPQPQPWAMGPTKAVRLAEDFDLAEDRTEILGRLAADGDLGSQGYKGVFFFDEAKGEIHGYSPVSWQIIYDGVPMGKTYPESFILIPIREAELRFKTNDPKAPNCIGRYRGESQATISNECATSLTVDDPPWGGITNATPGQSDAKIQGYFLITELEQIYSPVLRQTLCVHYPTLPVSTGAGFGIQGAEGKSADHRCRAIAANWDPANGKFPRGDWCAATNSVGTEECHDAYKSESWHAFQAFKVKEAACPALTPN